MAGPAKRRLVTEKRGFRVKLIKHPRYQYVVYRIEDGRRVEQSYFQSERAANSQHLLTNPAVPVPEAEEDPINAQVLSPEEFSRLIKSAEETLRSSREFGRLAYQNSFNQLDAVVRE
jgi:hypothetical protein